MICWVLFYTFFKIGAFTFGGGYAMLPLVQEEVLSHGWMSLQELVNFIAVSESTPGPFAVNCATYVGSVTAGPLGAFCATLGVVLPSFIVILLVARAFHAFRENLLVRGAMRGLEPAVVGLIASSIVSVGAAVFFPGGTKDLLTAGGLQSALLSPAFICSLLIFVNMTFLALKKVHPILLIVISAAAGIAFGYALHL